MERFPAAVRAPEFPDELTWFNGPPIRLAGVGGRAVLFDVWTYG